MQKLVLTLLVCSSLFVFSCNDKDPDPPIEQPTDTTASKATLLTKTVLTQPNGTITMTYQYDAQNRLSWYSNTSSKADYFEDTSKIIRDANGVITQIVYRSDTSRRYNDPALDSVVFNVISSGGKYTDKVSKYTLFKKFNVRDSSHYTYSGNQIVKEETFYYDTTKSYKAVGKNDFTYDAAGNVTAINTVYYNVNNADYPFQILYTYDDKGVNLLNFGNDAIVIGMTQNFSAHPPLTLTSTYPLNPEFNRSLTYKYTYNTTYRPLRADITDAANGNQKSTLVFTYQ